MSELLKKIIQSQAIKEDRFYVRDDGKVYERIVTKEDTFTGYYQDAAGVLYTEEGWKAEKERLFKEFERKKKEELQIAQEERSAKVRARKEQLVQEVVSRGRKRKNYVKVYTTIAIVLVMLGILSYGLWERNYKEETSTATKTTIEEEQIEEPTLFGNAIITGDAVNLREGPSTNTKVITSLGAMGERVEVIFQDSTTPKWEKIRREDGTQGWVYDLYLKKLYSLHY